MADRDALINAMRQREIRVTAQRALILETLAGLDGHSTAQEVFDHASPRLPGLNLATVYRNLYRLHEAGLVDLMSMGPGVQRFAYRDPDHLHAHLVCQQCQHVQEIPPEVFKDLKRKLDERFDFQLDARHLTLSGVCSDCS